MNIGIDGRFLAGNRTGIGRYVYELCKAIDKLLPDANFFVYSNLPLQPPVVSARWTYRIEQKPPLFYNKQSNLWLKTRLYDVCKKDNLDIFWATATLLPRLPKNTKIVSTVQDLSFVIAPQTMHFFTFLMHKIFFKTDLRKADMLTAISQGTATRLSEMYGCRVGTILHPAADKGFRPQARQEIDTILNLYNITKPFILSVGTWEPRKNIGILIETFTSMKRQGLLKDYRLILVGNKGWKYRPIWSMVRKNNNKDISYLGYVPDAHLPSIYAGARVFVFPSMYEGFGMPVLEARCCGTYVVTSDIPELRESGGTDTIYIRPNKSGIRNGILQALSRGQKIMPSSEMLYSWDRSAQLLAQTFHEALSLQWP